MSRKSQHDAKCVPTQCYIIGNVSNRNKIGTWDISWEYSNRRDTKIDKITE